MSDAPDADLLDRCRDRGFTPGARDVAPLLEAWRRARHAGNDGKIVVQALCRADAGVARKLERGFAEAEGAERAMRLRVLARISRRVALASMPELLQLALEDEEPRVVREAVRAIAKLAEAEAAAHEDTLIRITREAALPEQRAAVEALGLVGNERGLARLRELAAASPEDGELARRVAQALTLIGRRSSSGEASRLVLDHPLARRVLVRVRCRGAARLVAEEARARLPSKYTSALEVRNDRVLTLEWSGPLAGLQALRTALDWGLVFPLPPGEELAERIVAGLASPALLDALQTWTEGAIRFRLEFAGAGARRSVAWAVAQALDASASPLRNATREVGWTVEIDEVRGRIVCLPRASDERFAYRVSDIPAASHPTLAALMARVAGPRRGELVWDPYCGCGAELIECSRLAPELRLVGTDTDPRAIAAARANIARADLDPRKIRVELDDVYAGSPGPATADVIVTNPPMGRRAAVHGGLHASLCAFVAHAARVLRPGGRLVWVTPAARVTGEAGAAAGLRVDDLGAIDMSGLRVVLQTMRRRS